MSTEPSSATAASIRRHIVGGVITACFVLIGIGGLSAAIRFSGAVVASGSLVVETRTKKIQHPAGGVVGKILVREGALVKTGDLLIRLDETIVYANFASVSNSLDELVTREARLKAERDGLTKLVFPSNFLGKTRKSSAENLSDEEIVLFDLRLTKFGAGGSGGSEAASLPEPINNDSHNAERLMAGEQRLFELRQVARLGQKAQLNERIAQSQEEVRGLEAQVTAKAREIELIKDEVVAVRALWQKNLTTISRVTAIEREVTRLEGERGQLISAAAQARGKIAEIELQIIQLDQQFRSEVAAELRETQGKVSELTERKVAAEDHLKRVEIRAPQSGIVHQLQTHTVGGVIGAGETIMLIVPNSDSLAVEVKVSPQDIDQLQIGQPVAVRFSAFSLGTTPELSGFLTEISADVVTDPRTGANYFVVRIVLPETEVSRLDGLKLVPGMPVEAFIQTRMRTFLSYLVKPLYDQTLRAFRER